MPADAFVPRSIVIVFPYAPPVGLNGNRRGRWNAHAGAIAQLREDARLAALAQLPPGWLPLAGLVEQSMLVLYPRGQRLPDLDNTIASCKSIIDGLAEAGVVVNDNRIRRYAEVEHAAVADDGTGSVRITLAEYAPWSSRPEAQRRRCG